MNIFAEAGCFLMRGRLLSKKGGSEKKLRGSEKIFGGSEFKLGGSEKFFPAEFFFSTSSFSEKSWVAVGMCAGRLEISGQDS